MDRRLTPATDRVALRGSGIARDTLTEGRPMRVAAPVADLLRAPGGARDRQLLHGADVTLIEERDGWGFVQAAADGYCGWVARSALTGDRPAITHRVTAAATHRYPAADFKRPERGSLPMGARLSVTGTEGRFARLADGLFVPVQHISEAAAEDPAEVALRLIGTPYLWGGRTSLGLDCSGLVQLCLDAAGLPCPRDADMQERDLGQALPLDLAGLRRGDFVFWRGHVGLMLDPGTLIHANGHHMAVAAEPLDAAVARIRVNSFGAVTGLRRL